MSELIHYAERNAHQCWTCKNRVGQVKHTISIMNADGIPSKLGVLLPECKITGSGMWWVNECPCSEYICIYENRNESKIRNAGNADLVARRVLAKLTGGTTNDTMDSLTARLIFQGGENPKSQFNHCSDDIRADKVRGRPKKDTVRDQIIRIRLTPVEHEQIHKSAESEEITMSEFIRNAVSAYMANGGRKNL